MVEFNGTLYSYVHNLQGDIVGIVDSSGSLVVEYKYDAWGKPTLVRTLTTAYEALAELNPFRYRGYVYDEETGLYYLRSRYYSPKLGKFLISDYWLCTGQGVFSANRYCYCGNNPVIAIDGDGYLFMLLTAAIGAAVGAAVGAIVAAVNDEDILKGALVGAAVGGAVGLVGGAVTSLVTTGSALSSTGAVTAAIKGTASVASVGTGVNSVYVSYTAQKTVQYVGITNNILRRAAEHLASRGIQITEILKNMSRFDARAVEQCLIEYYKLGRNGGALINKINSIAVSNPSYSAAIRRGWELIRRYNLL